LRLRSATPRGADSVRSQPDEKLTKTVEWLLQEARKDLGALERTRAEVERCETQARLAILRLEDELNRLQSRNPAA
jgi:hypothetical protein